MVSGQRIFVYGRSQNEATEKLRELRTQAAKSGSLPTATQKLTTSEYLHTWLESSTLITYFQGSVSFPMLVILLIFILSLLCLRLRMLGLILMSENRILISMFLK